MGKNVKNSENKSRYRDRFANWLTTPSGKLRSRLTDAGRDELKAAITNPVAWFKGAQTPDGYVTPWELFIFAVSNMFTVGAGGFSGKLDFLFKEWYHIKPNDMTKAGIISSIWDAVNDPILGSFMDRRKMGPKQWRRIMRLSAVTGHIFVLLKMLDGKMLVDGGFSNTQHLIILVFFNCLQDIIGTMDSVAGQKLRAGISPYTQQRTRTQVWSSIGSSMGYTISAIPMLLMGLQDVFHLNDYQIIVMGTAIMLPFNIFASFLITFIKQRVDFKYTGKPVNSLPYVDEAVLNAAQQPQEEEEHEETEEEYAARKAQEKKAKEAYQKARIERDRILDKMTYKERRAWKKAHKVDFREKIANGEIPLDPETGEPKLSMLQSFEVIKYNKYFIYNTIGNFITVFTPSVDQTLVYRYLVPRFKIFGKEISGEVFLVARDYIIGTPITFTKPFSRQFVNMCGGPIRVHKINSIVNIVAALIKLAVGINKFWKLAVNLLLDAVLYVIADMDTVAGTMLNYEMYDLVELETGVRTEGVTNSINGLFAKIVTNNIGAATGNAFLQWTGYTGGYKNTGEELPQRFQKWMWPMFTLSTAFDNAVFLIMRSLVKHTPEDARRIEQELIELRKSVVPDEEAAGADAAQKEDVPIQ